MTIKEVEHRLQTMRDLSYDYEEAHTLEDELYYDFVSEIAKGEIENPQEIADLILTTKSIQFPRVYR